MEEMKKSAALEEMIDYACTVTGEKRVFSSAAFLVAVIDSFTGKGVKAGKELIKYADAFIIGRKIDIAKLRELLVESLVYCDGAERYDEVYIKTAVQDAELMAEKEGRDTVSPRDLFLSIVLRPDRITKECMCNACSGKYNLY